jgi:glycerophosphoryl diester phosphodiesterase
VRLAVWAFIVSANAASAAVTSRPAEVFDPRSQTGLPAAWEITGGSWVVKSGRLRASTEGGSAEATIMLGPRTWRDVAVEADMAFAPAADARTAFSLLVREQNDAAPGVQFAVRHDGTRPGRVEIAAKRPSPGQGWRVLQRSRLAESLSGDKVHRVRIEAVGRWIIGYVDGTRVLRSCRGDEFGAPGRLGLRVNGGTVVIDRVAVQRLSAADEPRLVRTRPLCIAHRGFSSVAPENTLASYRRAIQVGAEMAECDVYLTKDGVPILLHDETLERTAGRKAMPGDLTLAEIKTLDAGAWKSPEFVGERVPTLQEALESVKGRLRLVIELKEPSIAPAVIKAIHAAGVQPEDVVIFSFHPGAVDQIARLEPLLPTVWLVDDPGTSRAAWGKVIRESLRLRASGLGLSLTCVDPDLVRLAHESGLSVYVWTINEPQDMSYLVRLGVDAIITDRPDVLLGLLGG